MNKLIPYDPPHWAKCLRNPPSSIVQLAMKPTPVHQWNIPDVPSPFTVHIKRDDLVGNVLSGNKCRKAELLLGQALERGCDSLLICGTAVWSNHSTTMATAARGLGLEPYLFLRSQAMEADAIGCRGNVMLNRLAGARITLVPAKDYDRSVHPRMWKMEEKLRRQGKEPYVIQVGGSTYVSLFAYISAFEEMIEQGVLDNFDDIVVTGGSGGTASGLAIANYLTGLKLKIHAVSVSSPEVLYKQLNGNLIASGLEAKAEDILDVIDGYRGDGYNTSTTDELEYIIKLSTTTGILCDPVYTVKGVRGMVAEMKSQPGRFKGYRVLFVHTGGTLGLFTGRLDSLVTTSPLTNQISTWKNFDDDPPW